MHENKTSSSNITGGYILGMLALITLLACSPLNNKERLDIFTIALLITIHKSGLIRKIDTDTKIVFTYAIIIAAVLI